MSPKPFLDLDMNFTGLSKHVKKGDSIDKTRDGSNDQQPQESDLNKIQAEENLIKASSSLASSNESVPFSGGSLLSFLFNDDDRNETETEDSQASILQKVAESNNSYSNHEINSCKSDDLEKLQQPELQIPSSKPQQKTLENHTKRKPQRRKLPVDDDTYTPPSPRPAGVEFTLLKKGLERELGYHALFDDGRKPKYNSSSSISSNRSAQTIIPYPATIPVYKLETVGRRIERPTLESIFDETMPYHFRKPLPSFSRVLIVDEDTRVEDAIENHTHALEKRLNRNNASALLMFDDENEPRIETPVGYEYPDRVLRRKHLIAWKLAEASPMAKKEVVETSIPMAATKVYTRRISVWHRICSRLKLCCTWAWVSPNSDIAVESGLLTADSIEAFQQEVNIMEYLGAQHVRTLERRQSLTGSSPSTKKLMKNLQESSGPLRRR